MNLGAISQIAFGASEPLAGALDGTPASLRRPLVKPFESDRGGVWSARVLQLLKAHDGSTTRLCEAIAGGPVEVHVESQTATDNVPVQVRDMLPGTHLAAAAFGGELVLTQHEVALVDRRYRTAIVMSAVGAVALIVELARGGLHWPPAVPGWWGLA